MVVGRAPVMGGDGALRLPREHAGTGQRRPAPGSRV